MKTNKILSDGVLAFILITAILLIDQVIKIEVKTHFSLGESVHITDWFYISFVENNGMAYGMTFFNKMVYSAGAQAKTHHGIHRRVVDDSCRCSGKHP